MNVRWPQQRALEFEDCRVVPLSQAALRKARLACYFPEMHPAERAAFLALLITVRINRGLGLPVFS